MRKTFLHKTISSVLVLIFFVISNVIVKAEQTNNNSSKKQNWKIKQFINDVWNRVNSGQIITQEQKNKIQEQINKKFNKTKPENIKKVFSWAIQEFNQATPEIKGRILNNVGSWNITKIKNQIENKKKEIIKDIKQDIQNQKNIHIEEAKKQFEAKKQEILNLAKSGKIWNEEAKKQILAHRNIMIEQTKVDIRVWAEKLKQEKISNVKSVVKKQFETKLADLNKLSNQQQKAKYIKLDASIDVLSKKSTQAQNEVYKIMREVLREKIDSLK